VQVSSTGKSEDWSFVADAEETSFLRTSKRGFGNFVGKVNLDAVTFGKRFIEGLARVKGL
jgi:hypothetical protein